MLLTSVKNTGRPGQIVDTGPTRIERVRYKSGATAETYTLNLGAVNPVSGVYRINISGAPVTLAFVRNTALSAMADFVAQWSAAINRYGSYWASITAPTEITMTSRLLGTSNPVVLSEGMGSAVLVRTVNPLTPMPLVAGTLVFWTNQYSSNPDDHSEVTTYNNVTTVSEFRDVAGIVVRQEDNYSDIDVIQGTSLEIMRIGRIWVRNYGFTSINRSSTVTYNRLASSPVLPGGAIGTGTAVGADLGRVLQYDSYAAPMDMVRLRVGLV